MFLGLKAINKQTNKQAQSHTVLQSHRPIEIGPQTVRLQFDGLITVEDGLGVYSFQSVVAGSAQVGLMDR